MDKKIEFETFRNFGSYELSGLKSSKPSAVNFLSYKKFKVTIEPIEETNEAYVNRLKEMLELPENSGYNTQSRIKKEIEKLTK